ncbi:hypothetical protein FRC19_003219 [Serendipita sp. 401]|nr:hypothetical protein FRC19_003219 [Serendipita sp. 401]
MEQPPLLGSARVVLWDPNGSNRFVVGGGNELKMYEWNHQESEVKQVGIRSDLQTMRCFAWSPHSVYNDLLAIGLQDGVVTIGRLDQVMPVSGTSVSTTKTSASFSISSKNRRQCTSLAFCKLNPNLLANGLDKCRTEYSLVIWDLEQSASVFEASAIDDHFDKLTGPLINHAGYPSRLARSGLHPRSSSSSSNTVAAKPGSDLTRVPSRGKSTYPKPHQEGPTGLYCEAEGINSCVFQPQSSWEVVAGVNNKLIRYFDLRVRTKAVREAQTRAVRGICCDPVDGNLLASLDETGVHVWDRRKHMQPVMVFQEEDAGLDLATMIANPMPQAQAMGRITGVEFCNTRRNILGTTTRDGGYVRLWSLVEGEPIGLDGLLHDDRSESTDLQTRSDWAIRGSYAGTGTTPSEGRRQTPVDEGGMILSATRRTKISPKTVASFDFIPRSAAPSSAPHIVAVSKSGDIDLTAIRDSPRHQWSSRGELIASVGKTYKVYHTHAGIVGESTQEPWDIQLQDDTPSSLLQDNDRPTDVHKRDGLLSVQYEPKRKISPASAIRVPFEKKQGPASSISTPRPALTPLDSDDAVNTPGATKQDGPFQLKSLQGLHPASRSGPRSGKHSERRFAERGLGQDISAIIRRRAVQGYGLESAKHNSEIVKDDGGAADLSEIWLWLHTSNKFLQAEDALTHIHGFDFTLRGVLPIWEGFPPLQKLTAEPSKRTAQWQPAVQRSQRRLSSALSATAPRNTQDTRFGNYVSAVEVLNRRNADSRTGSITFPSSSQKVAQRRLGLSLVGWNISDEEMGHLIREWEKERSSGRAACWAVFMGRVERGIDILGHSHDERHRLLSAVMAAGFHLQGSQDSTAYVQWRDKCQTLVTRLDDPYCRVLLTWFITSDWRETIQDVPIPLTERIGMALRFLDDAEVSDFLRENVKEASDTGDITAILLTGINEDAIRILQSHIDHTGDVQTAAIMGALAPKLYVYDKQPRRQHSNIATTNQEVSTKPQNHTVAKQIQAWFDAYSELLDKWKLFHYRAQFDIDKGHLIMLAMSSRKPSTEVDGTVSGEVVGGLVEMAEWVPRQIELRCNTCGTSIGVSGPKTLPDVSSGTTAVAACPQCKQRLPRCVVCRMFMSFPGEPADSLLHNPVLDGEHIFPLLLSFVEQE